MTDTKRKAIVFGVLVIALGWGAWNLIPAESSEVQNSPTIAGSDPDPSDLERAAVEFPQFKIEMDTVVWKADPFARKQQKTVNTVNRPRPVDFKLTAISTRGNSAMAVIDGQVMSEGDRVESWQVTEITPSTVTLSNGSRSTTLSLRGR
jgi:hypothetical protein